MLPEAIHLPPAKNIESNMSTEYVTLNKVNLATVG
jgi:hypothetical protein